MKTHEARVLLEVDGETVGEMLETLQQFTQSLTSTDRVRVLGHQWGRPKDEVRQPVDIRKPNWKQFGKEKP